MRIFALVLTSLVLMACSVDKTSADYLASAEKAMEQGDSAVALIELRNAVRAEGTNALARLKLGQFYFRSGDYVSAEKELRLAAELGGPSDEILPLMMMALLELGELDAVIEQPYEGYAVRTQGYILAARGIAKLLQGDVSQASTYTEQAMELAPQEPFVVVSNARVLAGLSPQGRDLARNELQSFFEQEPEYAPAWELLGDIETVERSPEAAAKAYGEALLAGGGEAERLKRAFALIATGEYDSAQSEVDVLMAEYPEGPGPNFAEGVLNLRRNDIAEAIANFDIVMRSDIYPNVWIYAALAHFANGNLARAETYAEQSLELAGESAQARKLLASIRLKQGNPVEAESAIRPLADFSADDVEAKDLLQVALLRQNKIDEAALVAREVQELKPGSAAAAANLGRIYLFQGEYGRGEELLIHSMELSPSFQPGFDALASRYLATGRNQEASALATKFADDNPDSANALVAAASVLRRAGDLDGAIRLANQALKIQPGGAVAYNELAEVAIVRKDYNEAKQYLREHIAADSSSWDSWLLLARVYGLEGNTEALSEALENAVEANPVALQPSLVVARYSLVNGDPESALAALIPIGEGLQSVELYEVRARAYLSLGRHAEAENNLRKALVLAPENADLHFLHGQALLGMGEKKGAYDAFGEVATIDAAHLKARIALAQMDIASRNFSGAESRAVELGGLAPADASVLKLWVDLKLGQKEYADAEKYALRYFDVNPSGNSVTLLARAQHFSGNQNAAMKTMEMWLQQSPDDIEVRIALAEYYVMLGESDKAITEYQNALAKDPDNVTLMNNLAWHMRKVDPAAALEVARDAEAKAPNSVPVLDTLAVLYLDKGDYASAREKIERGLGLDDGNPLLLYRKAQLADSTGDKPGALRLLTELIGSGEYFPERKEAEGMYARLKN